LRLLLDAHVSSRHIGRPLATSGHDVLAIDQDQLLGRLLDEELLQLAVEQTRILITHNVRDFAPISRRWAEARRSHTGLVLVTLPSTSFGTILQGLGKTFALSPAQGDWIDRTVFVSGST
jgi:hypothetical protein